MSKYRDLTRSGSTGLASLRTSTPEIVKAFNEPGQAATAAGALDAKTATSFRRAVLRGILALVPALVVSTACQAADTDRDLHRYWDMRCKDCHGDAGAFARRTLRVEGGRLVGAHHERDLDLFLQHHYLTADLVAPVKGMLAAQVTTPPLFARHCSSCHANAAEFARKSLVLRGDVPVGRTTGRPVADYLRSHGGLQPEQIPTVVDALRRVLLEVGSPREGN
jgi:hypothetical protein